MADILTPAQKAGQTNHERAERRKKHGDRKSKKRS